MPKKLLTSIGQAIRQVREDRQISQETLAATAGLDRSYVSSVENGRRNVSIENLNRIAVALGVSMTEVMQLAEDRLSK
jgi:transcriptional regulator with XRE-family HTH domain